MLALLFLAAAAHAIPIHKKIPVFELAELQTRVTLENLNQLKAPCVEDCHHYILDQPIYIIAQPETNGKYLAHFTPQGLNSLGRSPTTIPFNDHLVTDQQMVTLIAPLGKFPFELFPGILQQEVHVPEHKVKLIDMYKFKDAPVVAIMPEVDFEKITQHNVFTRVADLVLEDNVYRIDKDYAVAHRLAPAPDHVRAHADIQVPQHVQKEQKELATPQLIQYAQQPFLDYQQVRLVPVHHFHPLELRAPIIPQQQYPQINQYPFIHQQGFF